jgi:hypothetical protein
MKKNHDEIYWLEAFPRLEKKLERFRKVPGLLYWHGVLMGFIEGKIFHNKFFY